MFLANRIIVGAILFTLVLGCYGNEFRCSKNVSKTSKSGPIRPVLTKVEASLLLLLGFGGFSVFLAFLYVFIRRKIFNDHNNLDSTFDAGGNVSASLSAVTIASQLLWPADLMQSVTVAVKYGIAGGFWYCAACLVSLALFPLLSFKFKTRAPGAKTYLQIILARFGRPAHTVFCAFALLVNVIVLSAIIVSVIAVLMITIEDVSPEYCLLVVVTLCGSYSFIGGLGSTFYVSYFNTLTTCVVLGTLVIKLFYTETPPYGNLEDIYHKVNCSTTVPGNLQGSYFTFLSKGSLLFAVQGFMLATSLIYCDQANWQSRIAAKPLQGAIGFLAAGSIWFTIPASISMVTALTYLVEVTNDPSQTLSPDQIDSGIVSTYMSEKALGRQGGIMMLTMLTMLTMSTGSGEIMGVSSIIVYDIYQTYVRPYRFKLPTAHCTFCGLAKAPPRPTLDEDAMCKCPPAETCPLCKSDVQAQVTSGKRPGNIVKYSCVSHGDYRLYQDQLLEFKNWCILWVTLALIPYGMVLHVSGIDLNWTFLVGSLVTVPAFPGVILSILWDKLTSQGIICGSLSGLVCGLASDAIVAYSYYQGEGGFFRSTSEQYSVLAGSCVGFTVTLVVTVLVSLATHRIRTQADRDAEWERMRNIDNPLNPWAKEFAEEFPEVLDGSTRPTCRQLEEFSKSGRLAAIIGSVVFFIVFIVLIPGVMASLEVLTVDQFKSWTTFINVWFFIMSVILIIVTPLEEIKIICRQIKLRRKSAVQEAPGEDHHHDHGLDFAFTRASGSSYQRARSSTTSSSSSSAVSNDATVLESNGVYRKNSRDDELTSSSSASFSSQANYRLSDSPDEFRCLQAGTTSSTPRSKSMNSLYDRIFHDDVNVHMGHNETNV